MKLTLESLGPIKKIVIVLCPNVHHLHPNKKEYMRYAILVSGSGDSVFLDDPTPNLMEAIRKRSASDVECGITMAECPFCQAFTSTNKG